MNYDPASTLWETLRATLAGWLRALVPMLLALLLLLISHLPGSFPSLAPVMPPLALMAVFYWAVHRPDWFGITSAFIVGVLADLLFGAPLGISAGLYAVSHILLTRQQRFFKGTTFQQVWAGYVVTQLVVTLGQALLWWLLLDRTPAPMQLLALNALGALLFPPVCWLLSRLHRALVDE